MQYPLAKLPNLIPPKTVNLNPRAIRPSTAHDHVTQQQQKRKSTPAFIDQESKISTLEKDNFSLKLRIYYLLQEMGGASGGKADVATLLRDVCNYN